MAKGQVFQLQCGSGFQQRRKSGSQHRKHSAPWQQAYVKRVIGTLRRECLDHVLVCNDASLYRHVKSFVAYYHKSRTNLSLDKDAPEPRPVQPPEIGRVIAIPQVGGLHHRYERRAA
jgi:hypothetical protein